MRSEGKKALLFFAVMGTAVTAATFLAVRGLSRAAGPETAIFSLIKDGEDEPLAVALPGIDVPLDLDERFYQRVTVEADPKARTALATATLDAEGRLGKTKVSSLGLERIRFEYRDHQWQPVGGLAPRLTGIVTALETRRRALEAGDVETLARLARTDAGNLAGYAALAEALGATDRRYRVSAWFIRSERGQVEVREEYRFEGTLPDRPVDRKGARLLRLTEERGEFFFGAGLM